MATHKASPASLTACSTWRSRGRGPAEFRTRRAQKRGRPRRDRDCLRSREGQCRRSTRTRRDRGTERERAAGRPRRPVQCGRVEQPGCRGREKTQAEAGGGDRRSHASRETNKELGRSRQQQPHRERRERPAKPGDRGSRQRGNVQRGARVPIVAAARTSKVRTSATRSATSAAASFDSRPFGYVGLADRRASLYASPARSTVV